MSSNVAELSYGGIFLPLGLDRPNLGIINSAGDISSLLGLKEKTRVVKTLEILNNCLSLKATRS